MKKLLCVLLCCTLLSSCSSDKRSAPQEGRLSLSPKAELVSTKNAIKLNKVQNPSQWHHIYQNTQNNRPHIQSIPDKDTDWTVDIGKNYDIDNLPNAPVVVVQDAIYALNGAFELVKINRADGQLVWRKKLSEDSAKQIGLATNGSQVFVISEQGHLISVKPDGEIAWEKELSMPVRTTPTLSSNLIFVVSSKNLLLALNQKTGKEVWRYKTTESDTFLRGMAHPALAQNILVVPFTTGEVIAFDAASGMILWGQMMVGNQVEDIYELPHILASPVINGSTVYLAGNANLLGAFNLQSGQTKWTHNIGTLITPVISGNTLFVLAKNHHLFALETTTGRVFWDKEMPHDKKTIWNNLTLTNNMLLVQDAEQVYHIDPLTGEVKKKTDKTNFITEPIAVNETSFVLTNRAKVKSYHQGAK